MVDRAAAEKTMVTNPDGALPLPLGRPPGTWALPWARSAVAGCLFRQEVISQKLSTCLLCVGTGVRAADTASALCPEGT